MPNTPPLKIPPTVAVHLVRASRCFAVIPRSAAVPTLVLHGTEDPMFPPVHAEATAAAVPGARLVMIEGMGHTLPRSLDDRLAAEILRHTARAQV
ncbi:alpha/beta fold hydrolase [Streptomyces collinus]|uniref:alpha/beta fold hydrolase n=1 Tax=Streptomyces collinus TaxID=42684 RepID=UPI0036C93870